MVRFGPKPNGEISGPSTRALGECFGFFGLELGLGLGSESSSRCAAPKSEWSGLGRSQMEESAVRRHELSVNTLGSSGADSPPRHTSQDTKPDKDERAAKRLALSAKSWDQGAAVPGLRLRPAQGLRGATTTVDCGSESEGLGGTVSHSVCIRFGGFLCLGYPLYASIYSPRCDCVCVCVCVCAGVGWFVRLSGGRGRRLLLTHVHRA